MTQFTVLPPNARHAPQSMCKNKTKKYARPVGRQPEQVVVKEESFEFNENTRAGPDAWGDAVRALREQGVQL